VSPVSALVAHRVQRGSSESPTSLLARTTFLPPNPVVIDRDERRRVMAARAHVVLGAAEREGVGTPGRLGGPGNLPTSDRREGAGANGKRQAG